MMTVLIFIIMGICTVYDVRDRKVPFIWMALGGVLSLIETVIALTDHVRTPMMILAALLPGVFLLILGFVTRHAVGYGDGLLMCAVGPALGAGLMAGALMLAFFMSALMGIVLLVFKKADRKTKIPFVPFLMSAMGVMKFVLL